jgi:hypothetical protein
MLVARGVVKNSGKMVTTSIFMSATPVQQSRNDHSLSRVATKSLSRAATQNR